ncbi:PucR C-terminal helix-turn-helix domain-containing protein [Blastococcus aggregatus]|uniref:PucR C-terminal helix-turn-helix domain-containing protein n=1 Tax=Blastococcus aggregatus TaxID=38502 RepID=A0A285V0G7_9ACTN|nr:helix-turn-helix domain-containing protein [Blastococcus aggregatus]SOC47533.1 PucR C-terminal helix-turn-helix domain-containing protein [Blastococcus aggregatus]
MSQPRSDDGVEARAAALAARLVPQVPALARRVVDRIRAEVPGFESLPGEVQDLEVAATARSAIRAFLQHAQGLPGSRTGLSEERAVQRAEEGIPLAALVQTYLLGAEVVVDALAAAAGPDDAAAVLHLTREQLRAVGLAVTRVAEAYLAGAADQHVAVRELTWALVRGERPEDVAARYGLPLENGYLVLRVRAAHGGDRQAARAALRWVLARTAPRAGGRALSLRDDLGGFVLLPPSFPVEELTRPASSGDAVPVVGVAPAAAPADVPAAAARADRIAAVAGRPGIHRLSDVLLEYHLTGPLDSAAEVAAVLEPLAGHPDLLPTLVAFLGADLNRRGAAQDLGVHANTVDNRLERIGELTGVDPRSARGIQLFGAAIAVRRAIS